MRKPIVTVVVIVVITLALLGGVYLVLKNLQQRASAASTDPFLWIPENAESVLHLKNPELITDNLTNLGPLSSDLAKIALPGIDPALFSKIDSLFSQNSKIAENWAKAQIVVATLPADTAQQQPVLVQITFPAGKHMKLISELVENYSDNLTAKTDSVQVDMNPHKEHGLFGSLSHQMKDNILLLSTLEIKESDFSITDTPAGTIAANSSFATLRSKANLFADNFYISQSALCKIMGETSPFENITPLNCNDLTDWYVWDVSYQPSSFFLSGMALSLVHGEKLSDIFNQEYHAESSITRLVPADIDALLWFDAGNNTEFKPRFEQWLSLAGKPAQLSDIRTRFKDITSLDPDSVGGLWSGELAVVKPAAADSKNPIIIVGINEALQLLISDTLSPFFPVQPNLSYQAVNSSTRMRSLIPGFIPLLTNGFILQDYTYLTIINNYIIAASNDSLLAEYLDIVAFGRTFGLAEEMQQFNEYFPKGQSLYYFSRNHKSKDESIIGSRSFSFQMTAAPGGGTFSNAMLLHNNQFTLSNPIEWQTDLEAPVLKGPFHMINHIDNSNEIIVQDQANNLYLLDNDGKILWKKELSGPSLSNIYQVDIFKNKRFQYLFNTRNFLHLIDRNGDYVRGYPMRLPSPASAGLSLFDYDGKKDYRIVIPAENRRIYNFNLLRQQVRGWNYRQTEAIVDQPAVHYRLDGKDYIVITDNRGRIHITDRSGSNRVRPNEPVTIAQNQRVFAHQPSEGKSYFIFTRDDGTIQQLFIDGTLLTIPIDTLSGDFTMIFDHFTRPPEKDIIVLNNGTIKVYTITGRLIFSLSLGRSNSETMSPASIASINNQNFLSILEPGTQRLFLINDQGKVQWPFPLPGETPMPVIRSKQNDLQVVAGIGNKIISYIIQPGTERIPEANFGTVPELADTNTTDNQLP